MFNAASRSQEICAWVFVTLFLCVRAYFWLTRRFTQESDKFAKGRYYLRASFFIIIACSVVAFAVPRDTDGWHWAFILLPPAVKWIGVGLGFLSVILFFWVHKELGNNWQAFIVVQGEPVLMTGGPFAMARHPMYTVFLLFIIAVFLSSEFILPTIALFVIWLWATSSIPEEERFMVSEKYINGKNQKLLERT